METADVFDLQQHARRVPRVVFVEGDSEGEQAAAGGEIALIRYRATVEPQRLHRQPASPERLLCDRPEITLIGFIRRDGGVLPTLPTAGFQSEKLFDPHGDVVIRGELVIFEAPDLRQLSFLASDHLAMLG